MADRSLKHPRGGGEGGGEIEDVLVKVDKFIFPTDFILLNMEEDKEIPIILGRPFLATNGALIEVQKGEVVNSRGKSRVAQRVAQKIKGMVAKIVQPP